MRDLQRSVHGGGAVTDPDGKDGGEVRGSSSVEDGRELFVEVEMGVGIDQHSQVLVYEVMMSDMSEMTRRNFGVVAAMFAALGSTAEEQEPSGGTLGPSKVFAPDMTKLPNGSERWQGSNGTLATGEAVGFHESAVPAGTPKVELHVIKHSELLMVAEGTLSVEHDGVVDEAKPGAVIYVAYGTNHRVWNSGTTTARYFVIQMGGDTRKA